MLDAPLRSEELTFTCQARVANTTEEALDMVNNPYCDETQTGSNSKLTNDFPSTEVLKLNKKLNT